MLSEIVDERNLPQVQVDALFEGRPHTDNKL